MDTKFNTPMLFPLEPETFWQQLRLIVREEVARQERPPVPTMAVAGLTEKPLFKISEICDLFQVSRQTIYAWAREGKLHPVKVRSRVYFLSKEIRELLHSPQA